MAEQKRKKIKLELVENSGWDERILVFRCAPVVDAFAVITERYVVVVDTLISPRMAEHMMGFLEHYLQEGRQLLVVNTHSDWDHTWGNQIFIGEQPVYPAPVLGLRESVRFFHTPEAEAYVQQMQEQNPDMFDGLVLTPPTVLFDERLNIDGGDLSLELIATPGHTIDHVSVFIPEIRTVLVGDAAETPYPVARQSKFMPRLRRSLNMLAALEPAVALYCHAPGVTTAEVIHDNIAYFDALEHCCRQALEAGKLPDPLPEEIDLIAATGCHFEDIIAPRRNPSEMNEYYRTLGHNQQLRHMVQALRREKPD